MLRQWIARLAGLAACALLGFVSVAAAGHKDGCCPDEPCVYCKPTVEKKTVSKRVYGDKCEPFCQSCSIWGMLCHRCDCSKVMYRKYLLLKVRKSEKCVPKCVPVVVPPCGAPSNMERCAADLQAPAKPQPASTAPPASGAPQPRLPGARPN